MSAPSPSRAGGSGDAREALGDEPTTPGSSDSYAGMKGELTELRRLGDDRYAQRMREQLAAKLFGVEAEPSYLGRFALLEQHGAGGMGVVHRAYDPKLDRSVALKLLHPSDGSEAPGGRNQLLREAHALARVSHPNVVAVHEVGELDGDVFIVMEFVVGRTLEAWVKQEDPAWSSIIAAYVQAGRGLAAAHEAGLVHRDFKPSNALVGDDGRVRVVDFGLAQVDPEGAREPDGEALTDAVETRTLATLRRSHERYGTPGFMAPEQMRRGPVDARSDQYSFCVALYEALYRVHPVPGERPAEWAENLLKGTLRDPPRTAVPGWVFPVLRRGLSYDARERYPSMSALLEALQPEVATVPRWWLTGVTIVALGVVVGAQILPDVTGAGPCETASRALEDIWNGRRQDAVTAAFARGRSPHDAGTGERVGEALDTYAARWHGVNVQMCELRASGETKLAEVHRGERCLQRARVALESAADLLVEPDASVREHAMVMVERLPAIRACEFRAALDEEAASPEEDEASEALRARVIRIARLADAGQRDAAARGLNGVIEEARAGGHSAVLAEALLEQGRHGLMEGAASPESSLSEAQRLALDVGDDRVGAETYARLMYIEGHKDVPHVPAEYEIVAAERRIRQLDDPVPQLALFRNNLGAVYLATGELARARAAFLDALAAWESVEEKRPIDISYTRFNLALLTEDAEERARRWDEVISERTTLLGETHLETINAAIASARTTPEPEDALELLRAQCDLLALYYPALLMRRVSCLEAQAVVERALGLTDAAVATELQFLATLDGLPEVNELHRRRAELRVAAAAGLHDQVEAEAAALLAGKETGDMNLWLRAVAADIQLQRGVALIERGDARAATEPLEIAVSSLAAVSEGRADIVFQIALQQSRRALAGALLTVAEDRGAPEGAESIARAAELIDAAARWSEGPGAGYSLARAEVDVLRGRLRALVEPGPRAG